MSTSAGADAGPDVEVGEVGDVLPEPSPLLAEGGEVHVVLEGDLRAQLLLHGFDEPGPAPSGERVRELHGALGGVEDAGAPDGREGHLTPPDVRLGGEAVRDLADLGDQRALALHHRAFVTPGDDVAGEVRDRRPDPGATDVDADHPSRARVQLVEDRGGPPLAARSPGLPDETGFEQRRERLRHGGLGEVAVAGDLGPRDGAHPPHELEHGTLVDRTQEARCPAGERLVEARRLPLPRPGAACPLRTLRKVS